MEQAVRHKDSSNKALAHSTFVQMLSQLPSSLSSVKDIDSSTDVKDYINSSTDVKDYIGVLTWLVGKVPNRTGSLRQAMSEIYLKHYLSGLVAFLSATPQSVADIPSFTDIVWQHLCPALIQLLGNPMVDKAAQRGKVNISKSK